jgi:hypothetical protein
MLIKCFDNRRYSKLFFILYCVSFIFYLIPAGCSTEKQTCDFKMNIFAMGLPEAKKVTVNGSALANVQRIQWDWGDGIVDEHHFFPASHAYGKPGRYTITVTVYNVHDCSDRKSISVDIK